MSSEASPDNEKRAASVKERVQDNTSVSSRPFDSTRERRLVRKLDRRILPITCLMYLCAYLDRSNLGNARLQGLPEDALGGDPKGTKFAWINTAFFISYVVFQIPASLMSKVISPRLWLGICSVGWGICSTLMSTGFDVAGLAVARVGLGAFEAGMGPGVTFYFSLFYVSEEMGLRMGYWFGFAAVAGAFGGLIAYGLQHAHTAVSSWRLLFIVEGIPSVLIGIVTLLLLPDRPERTTLFSVEERELALERANRRAKADVGNHIDGGHIKLALLDWRIYVGGIVYFGLNCGLASISAFLPTIIKGLGYKNATAQILTVPPYAVAAVVLTSAAWYTDRIQSRGITLAISSLIGSIGYLLLLVVPHNQHVLYFATFCITSGTYTTIGIFISWMTQNLGSETKRATGIPMFMAMGQCGSILGTQIYPSTEGPRYVKGFVVTGALELLASACCVLLTVSYRLDNRRRDRLYGRPSPSVPVDTTVLADKAPMFRYVP